jgi:hypothetical protein
VPFETYLETVQPDLTSPTLTVHGIGTVEIPIKRGARSGSANHGVLRLENVLHVPDAVCNVLGRQITESYSVDMGPTSLMTPLGCRLLDPNGRRAGFFVKAFGRTILKLSGSSTARETGGFVWAKPAKEMRDALEDQAESLVLLWPQTEKEKWERAKDFLMDYTDEERTYMATHFVDEDKFLQEHSLSIHDQEDKENGRYVFRLWMAVQKMVEKQDRQQTLVDEALAEPVSMERTATRNKRKPFRHRKRKVKTPRQDDPEADAHSTVAVSPGRQEPPYTAEEDVWLQDRFDGEGNFLLRHGLSIDKDEDRDAGRSIFRALLNGEDSDKDSDHGVDLYDGFHMVETPDYTSGPGTPEGGPDEIRTGIRRLSTR